MDPQTFCVDMILSARNTRSARFAIGPSMNRHLTYDDGLGFGRLLLFLGVPARHVDYATQNVLYDWRFPEHKEAWMSNEEFIRGRNDAYERISRDFQPITLASGRLEAEGSRPQQMQPDDKRLQREQLIADEFMRTGHQGWVIG